MVQIVAVIRPFLAEKLIFEISRLNVEEICIREVKGYSRQKNYLDRYSDNEYSRAFVPKVEVAIWVERSRAEVVLAKISEVARTGRLGDGKAFVIPVGDCVLIDEDIGQFVDDESQPS